MKVRDRFAVPPVTYRVVGVRYDGSRRILEEGQTRSSADSSQSKAGETRKFRIVLVEPE